MHRVVEEHAEARDVEVGTASRPAYFAFWNSYACGAISLN
jgi:hypothetical protein